jgi:hypothetical protein
MRTNFYVIFREGTELAIVHGKEQTANVLTSLKLTQKPCAYIQQEVGIQKSYKRMKRQGKELPHRIDL